MKNAILALSLLVASFAPQMVAADAGSKSASVRLTISVFNDAGASPSVMAQAQSRATLILLRAGISLLWLDCGTPRNAPPNSGCSDLSYPQHLSVRMVSNPGRPSKDTFGQTFQNASAEGNYALVFFNALVSSKTVEIVKTGDLLGHIIAHELGHLLLGSDSHSATGLMSAVWQAKELRQASQGILFFTSDQQDRIRARCLAAQTALAAASRRSSAGAGE
jgi:hypothetical protein